MSRVPINLRRSQTGVAMPVVIAAVAIIVLLAVAAWFLIIGPHVADKAAVEQAQTSSEASKANAAPPPGNVSAMGVDQLLSEAKKAMNDKRFIAPAGNNAFEYYLKVLEKRPGNQVAQDALRETFPFGASAAEQDINANSFEEAQREIELLAKADPGNYTLTILRSKLDAQRKLAARAEEQQKRAEALATQAEASSNNQPEPQESEATPPPQQQQESQSTAANQPAPTPTPPPAQPVTPQQAPEPAGPTRAARLVKSVKPVYPTSARRRRIEGWVDVQFTVEADGSVSNVHSVGSNRGRIFTRAAVDAVEQWKFEPALENGKPVAKVVVQHINFNL